MALRLASGLCPICAWVLAITLTDRLNLPFRDFCLPNSVLTSLSPQNSQIFSIYLVPPGTTSPAVLLTKPNPTVREGSIEARSENFVASVALHNLVQRARD